jgi:hypothetical protein
MRPGIGETMMAEQQSRREFVRGMFRGAWLAGLAGLCGWLLTGRQGKACHRPGICGGCPAFSRCRLPKAQSARSRTAPAMPAISRPT